MPIMTFEVAMGALEQYLISYVSEPVHPTVLVPWDLQSATNPVSQPRRSNLLHGDPSSAATQDYRLDKMHHQLQNSRRY
jgi:hypothetical protein